MNDKLHCWIALPLRGYLGIIFIWASLHKIVDPASFALDIATYEILPLALINPMAIVLPWVELIAGLGLVLGLATRACALLISGMMTLFLIAVIIAFVKGIETSCGCFASASLKEDPISAMTILRDSLWLAMAIYLTAFDRCPLTLAAIWRRRKAC